MERLCRGVEYPSPRETTVSALRSLRPACTGAFYPGVIFRPIANPSAEVAYDLLSKPDNRNSALHDFIRFAGGFAREAPASRPTSDSQAQVTTTKVMEL